MGQVPPPIAAAPITEVAPDLAPGGGSRGALGRFGGSALRLITTNRKVMAGSVIVAFFILVAIFGPLFVSQNPNHISSTLVAPPSAEHTLGTNQLGQDIFSQLVVGTRS